MSGIIENNPEKIYPQIAPIPQIRIGF